MSVFSDGFDDEYPADPLIKAQGKLRRSEARAAAAVWRIPADLRDDLKEVAALLGESPRQAIRLAITEFVERVRSEHPTTSPRRKTLSLNC